MKTTLIALVVSVSLISCGPTEYEKHIEDYNECLEEKLDNKNYKYANIQEALNAYDFEVARDYLACHPYRGCYSPYGGDKSECSEYSEYPSPYKEDLVLIVTAEITYFIGEGEFKRAESVAKEADLLELYAKIAGEGFEENLDNMIERKEYKKIYSYLSDKRFEYQKIEYDLTRDPSWNSPYQNGVREYNALLDKVLSKYAFEEMDTKIIKQVVDLALPELIEKPWRQVIHSKLSDEYKKEATAKYLNKK